MNPHDTDSDKQALITTGSIVTKPIVLVGMMGAGKTSIGSRLAMALDIPFWDADDEIEKAAQLSIPEIFEQHGETYFRDGERRVIARLINNGPCIIATGGGAFMAEETRKTISQEGLSIWLRAPLDELVRRVKRKPNKRPLLKGGKVKEKISKLLNERAPFYELADHIIDSENSDHEAIVDSIIVFLKNQQAGI